MPCGSSPEFSDDSKWLDCLIRPSYEEIDKLRKENKAVPQKVQLMKLATGEIFLWENAASFSFSPGSGFFAVKKNPASSEAPAAAANLIVRNLSEGSDELIGSVGEFCFNKQGTGLA